jgi:hypothetical protein
MSFSLMTVIRCRKIWPSLVEKAGGAGFTRHCHPDVRPDTLGRALMTSTTVPVKLYVACGLSALLFQGLSFIKLLIASEEQQEFDSFDLKGVSPGGG